MKRVATDYSARWPALTRKPAPLKPVAPSIDRTAIALGIAPDGFPILLPLKVRQEHALALGSTGAGKSRGLLHMSRQAISNGEGLCLVDPHGTEDYRDLSAWLAGRNTPTHVIDFNSSKVVGFNPLACPDGTDPSVIVGCVMDALSVSWEGESMAQKPTIERVMSAMLGALVELKLTLCEAPYILEHDDAHGLHRYAIEHVKDQFTRGVLKRLHELSQDGRRRRDFDQETVGPENRLGRLLRPPIIRAMLGQTENCLDFKNVMDNGEVLLANVSGGTQIYEKDADLFGRLLVRMTLFHAKRRATKRPFNLVLDEAHRFLSGDIKTILAEVRKYEVSVTAAMQWLAQAEEYDEKILEALLNGTNIKICFRLRDAEEAERMARSVVPLNLERPVAALIKPTVVGHQRTLLNNESDSTQQSQTKSKALAIGETETEGETVSDGVTVTKGASDGTTDVHGEVDAHSKSKGSSSNAGTSAAEIMIPTDDPDDPHVSRITAGLSSGSGETSSSSSTKATSRAQGKTHTDTSSVAYTSGTAYSRSLAKSLVVTDGEAETNGTGKSKGQSEALEPVMENLPTAVHSIQNELYAAGQVLLNLPRATGYVSYVGQRGAVRSLFTVPLLSFPEVSDEKFVELRDGFVQGPTLAEAHRIIEERAASMTQPERKPVFVRTKVTKPKDNPHTDHSEPDFY